MSEEAKPEPQITDVFINGIVAARDGKPYIQLMTSNGIMTQWNVAEARKIANDIVVMCSRVEADAMIIKFFGFFGKMNFPAGALGAIMQEFREFRHELDMQPVETKDDPERGDAE
jgi:hypothetical protein